MARLKIISTTTSSISVRIVGLDSKYSYSDRYALFSINNDDNDIIYEPLGAYISQSDIVTFPGLSAATNYTIRCTIGGIVGSDDVKLSSK